MFGGAGALRSYDQEAILPVNTGSEGVTRPFLGQLVQILQLVSQPGPQVVFFNESPEMIRPDMSLVLRHLYCLPECVSRVLDVVRLNAEHAISQLVVGA